MMRRWLWLCLLATPALAANREDAALDNTAALSGGVVVSTIRSGGAIWYNPAGLGGNARGKLDVSLNAFVLRERSAKGAVEGRVAEGVEARSDVDSLELATVPSSLVFSRRVSDTITIGLGVFVPRMDAYRVVSTTPIDQPPLRYVQRSEFTAVSQRYHAGPAIGWAASPRLRLGFALFGVYESESLSARLWSRISFDGEPAPLASLVLLADESISRFGVQPTAGVQWQPIDELHLGLTVRAPIVRVRGDSEGSALIQFAADGEPPVSEYDPDVFDDEPFGLMAPASVHGGLAWSLADGGFVAIAGEYRTALDDPAAERRYAAVWNIQLGGLWAVSDTIALGAGVFTDHSDTADLDGLGDDRVDFYGVTGGLRWRDPLKLESGGELIFETTIGARYAIGFGKAGGLSLDYLSEDLITEFEVDVVHHTAALHIGSALLF